MKIKEDIALDLKLAKQLEYQRFISSSLMASSEASVTDRYPKQKKGLQSKL